MAEGNLETARKHMAAGRFDQAALILGRTLARTPGDPDANSLMCGVLALQGKYRQAEFYIRRAVASRPTDADMLNDLGNCIALQGRTEEAVDVLTRAAGADPDHLGAAVSLAAALNTSHRYISAAEHCRRAEERLAGSAELTIAHATSLLCAARAEEAVAVLRGAAVEHPGHPQVLRRLAFALNYMPGVTGEELAAAHRAAGAALAGERGLGPPGQVRGIDVWAAETSMAPAAARDPKSRLRIGILSPDLRSHSVAYFARPMLERLDRGSFEVVCYSDTRAEDAMSGTLRSLAALWRNVDTLSDRQLADAIRADRIDILMELVGYTSKTRFGALLLKPAPVVVSYIGYPNTTGLAAVDYRIVDSLTDPAGDPYRADEYATERLVRLEGCFLCYSPPEGAPAVSPPPCAAAGHITFGSFNALQKINEPLIRLWAGVLGRVPGSRLRLKAGGLADAELRRDLTERFGRAGVESTRIEFRPWTATQAEHLAMYAGVDIALDTFPYCGTTTTCEAMLMGAPVVSLVGRTHASRVGLSLLTAVGLADLCAPDEERFMSIAAGLAHDRDRLAELRGALRGRLLGSALCDGAGFGTRLGAALLEMAGARGGARQRGHTI